MSFFQQAADYLLYRLRAIKLHGVHSPFIFDLYQNVICHTGAYQAYGRVENLRKELLQNDTHLQVTDFGAGPRAGRQRARSIKQIARTSAKPAKYGQLLFRLVNRFQPAIIFDLGTSLGITTAYLAEARQQAQLYTFEGCPNIAQQAQKDFQKSGLKNIRIVLGNLNDTLTPQLQAVDKVDFVFFDGNHRYAPTMHYFNACLAKHQEHSIFVVDDIYWSGEMKRAWQEIKKHPQVRQTVDLYFIGVVFFRRSQPKENFTLYF